MANNKNSRIWVWSDDMIPEVEYMRTKYHLKVNPCEYVNCYELYVHGIHKTYSKEFHIVFHDTVLDEDGKKVLFTKFCFLPISDKATWNGKMGDIPEITYLSKKFGFIYDSDSDDAMYQMKLNDGTWLAFPRQTTILFSKIRRTEAGEVESLKFRVVVKKEKIWYEEDGDCPEMEFLKMKFGLIIDPDNFDAMYRFKVKDEWYSYPKGSRCFISSRCYDEEGNLVSMRFKWQKLEWV